MPDDILSVGAFTLLAFWVGLALDRRRRWPRTGLPGRDGPAPTAAVAAIVPARDEADVLDRTLPALLTQEAGGSFVVHLIDDDSSDATAEVARAVAPPGGATLRIIPAAPRPPGWVGKVWAQECGHRALEGAPTWLLLTDADIRLAPGTLRALRAAQEATRADLVSVMARLEVASVMDRVLVPAFVWFFHLLHPFAKVNTAGGRGAAAAGGCMFVRREALARAGGFAGIRGAVIDDISLARAIARAGGRIWLGFDDRVESCRPYGGLPAFTRMVARSAYVQLGRNPLVVVVVVAALLGFFVSPPLIAGILLARGRIPPAGAALLAWCVQAALFLPAVRRQRVRTLFAFTLPLASLLFAAITLLSAWRDISGRGNAWKGRPAAALPPPPGA